jgi:hypothetical protein
MLVAILVRLGGFEVDSVCLVNFSGPIKHINVGGVKLERQSQTGRPR